MDDILDSIMKEYDDDSKNEPEDVPPPSYCDELMTLMNESRVNGSLCDVNLVVEDQTFPAHKIVLAAGSQFFNGLFNSEMKEKQQKKIVLKEVKYSVMENVLEYIYTGKTEVINEDNAHDLVRASSYFLVDGLKEVASSFICSCLSLENCLKTREFAEKYNCRSLEENCKEFLRNNFADIIEDEGFYELEYESIEELVSNENTAINKEEVMYETVKKWVMKSAATRKKHFKSLFCHIRLQQISKKYLNTVILKDELVTGTMSCMQFVLHSLSAMDSLPPLLKPRSTIDEHKDAVIICGGFDADNTPTTSAMCFFPSVNENESWRMLSPLSSPRYGSSSAFCGGFLYSIGGWEPPDNGDEPVDVAVKTVERYDPTTNTWLKVAPLPNEPERWVTATSLDGKIYVLCTSNNLFSYDPTQNTWDCVPSTPSNESEIHGACLVACSNNLYVIGGLDVNNTVMSRSLKFDPETLEWSVLTPMSVQRYLASAVTKANKIYVIGGLQQYESDAMGCALGSCEVYNIERDHWEMLPKLQNPRYSAGIACVWDDIYIFGGEHEGETQDNVEYFNEEKGHWEVVTTMPCRSYFSCHWVRMPVTYTQLDVIKPESFVLL